MDSSEPAPDAEALIRAVNEAIVTNMPNGLTDFLAWLYVGCVNSGFSEQRAFDLTTAALGWFLANTPPPFVPPGSPAQEEGA